jgi:hypothetical protein
MEYSHQNETEGEEREEFNEDGNEEGQNEEEMNFEDENENNGGNEQEYENIEERDSLKKTMTQNIGDDVIQIAEHPNNIYYNEENFCDYKP